MDPGPTQEVAAPSIHEPSCLPRIFERLKHDALCEENFAAS
jgi:hypothetical protein